MAKKTEDRFVTAAKKRAAILGILQHLGVPVPLCVLYEAPALKEFKFTTQGLQNLLSSMRKNKIIDSMAIDDPKAKIGYFIVGDERIEAQKPKRRYERKAKKEQSQPHIVAEYIPETGHVCLQFPGGAEFPEGFFIEVGIRRK